MDWRAYFAASERKLLASLAEIRAELSHGTSKGDRVEQDIRSLLHRHLPRRFDVGQGQALDQSGATTRQLDVVLTTDEQPITYPSGTPGIYLMEAIVAAAEVKSKLTTSTLEDALTKAASFKALRVQPATGDTVVGLATGGVDRFHHAPPFFVLALESDVAGATIHNTLRQLPDVLPADPGMPGGAQPTLDAVFTLDRGVFLNFADGQGRLKFGAPDGSATLAGWAWLPNGPTLLHLFWWLNATAPRRMSFAPVATPYLAPALRDAAAEAATFPEDWKMS